MSHHGGMSTYIFRTVPEDRPPVNAAGERLVRSDLDAALRELVRQLIQASGS